MNVTNGYLIIRVGGGYMKFPEWYVSTAQLIVSRIWINSGRNLGCRFNTYGKRDIVVSDDFVSCTSLLKEQAMGCAGAGKHSPLSLMPSSDRIAGMGVHVRKSRHVSLFGTDSAGTPPTSTPPRT